MTVSPASGAAHPPTVTGTEIAVAVLKKAQDVRKAEGQLLLELINQSKVPNVAGRLNVYA
jgi:hypothetical protein